MPLQLQRGDPGLKPGALLAVARQHEPDLRDLAGHLRGRLHQVEQTLLGRQSRHRAAEQHIVRPGLARHLGADRLPNRAARRPHQGREQGQVGAVVDQFGGRLGEPVATGEQLPARLRGRDVASRKPTVEAKRASPEGASQRTHLDVANIDDQLMGRDQRRARKPRQECRHELILSGRIGQHEMGEVDCPQPAEHRQIIGRPAQVDAMHPHPGSGDLLSPLVEDPVATA